jgi:hypothetical protein
MIKLGHIAVNIHNVGRIPVLNIPGPRYNINLSVGVYNLLRKNPRIEMYPIEEDPKMPLKNATAPLPKIAEPVKVENVRIEDGIRIKKEKLSVEELTKELRVSTEEIKHSEVLEKLKIEEAFVPKQSDEPKTDIDAAIDARISELPEEPEDDFNLAQSFGSSEQVKSVVRKYKQKDLKLMNKADLKKILNVERGYKIGDKYYGGYHDGHTALVRFILESQEEN